MSDIDLKDDTTADPAPAPLFTIGERAFTKDDAVKKIANADSFIEQLKAEGKTKDEELIQLRAKLDQATKLDEALASIKNSQGTSEPLSQEAPTSAIDIESLKKELLGSVNESLSEKERNAQALKNQEDSISAAQAVYGDAYESKLREKAKALGMSDEDIILEAATNPIKFKTLFGLNKTTFSTPFTSSTGRPPSNSTGKPELKLGGFSSTERVVNARSTLEAFAKARGVDPELLKNF